MSTEKSLKSETSETPLNLLLKFIKPYDGSRDRLNAFINNCNSAFDSASNNQKDIILKYTLCQLEEKAEIACSIKEFTNWQNLKDFLKSQFGETKHYAHLLTDLQDCKQNLSETVNQFALRVETCLGQLLTEINISCPKKSELAGRLAATEDLALHTFTIGLVPRISNIVRCKSPKTLNEAINLATSEEKLQLIIYKNTQPKSKPIESSFKSQNQNSRGFKPTFNIKNRSTPFCRYCKRIGHTLENCAIRDQNNKRFMNSSQSFSPTQSNNFKPRVTFTQEEEDVPEEEGGGGIDHLNEQMSR